MVNRRIRLLGPPAVEQDDHDVAGPTGHKAWGVLTHVALADRPPARTRTAAMLFPDDRDPRRTLRWNLSELRQVLGDTIELGDDPLRLVLGEDDELDVALVLNGTWPDPARLGGLGGLQLDPFDVDRHVLLVEALVAGGISGRRDITSSGARCCSARSSVHRCQSRSAPPWRGPAHPDRPLTSRRRRPPRPPSRLDGPRSLPERWPMG